MKQTSLSLVHSPLLRLFIVSFLILFLELVLIRYIPSQVRYVSFFSNIVLLASFVGIGFGALFWNKIRVPFFLFPFLLLLFYLFLAVTKYDLIVTSDQVIYFNLGFGNFASDPIFLLPVIFFAVVALMILPAVALGELFDKLPRLTAYGVNTFGSIAGIVTFALFSFFGVGPLVWFLLVIFLSLLVFQPPHLKHLILPYLLVILIIFVAEITDFPPQKSSVPGYEKVETLWSPYYKIGFFKHTSNDETHYLVNVNSVSHQNFIDPNSSLAPIFYQYPYAVFPDRKFKNVLIIGAGGGNDVAKALEEGAEKITAVDIDPAIIHLGQVYHPLKPYSSSKVRTVVDDGRSFLVSSSEKYDLVIFALTDSLTLSSAVSSLRLESYLFTKESFTDVKSRLAPDGVVVLYNFYRSPWIVDKLYFLLRDVFGREPAVYVATTKLGPAAILISGRDQVKLPSSPYTPRSISVKTPTDDWPFLYLKKPGIPSLYLSYIGVILAAISGLFLFAFKKSKIAFDWPLFFMGAAFMLLETKNVVQFSLLFGSTWLTNAFVFTGLLILVLLAILIARRFPKLPMMPLYIALFALIALAYVTAQRELLALPYLTRLVLAILINFSPVFVANLIFALLFAKVKVAPLAYGSNIFGAFFGGVLEYLSLLTGYRNLLIFVALFYALSLYFALRSLRVRM